MKTTSRRQPGADQLLLFADDEVPQTEEPQTQPWSPCADPINRQHEHDDGKPEPGIRVALRRRQERWDRRRAEDPEGVAAEEERVRVESEHLRNMLAETVGDTNFALSQHNQAMRLLQGFPKSSVLAEGFFSQSKGLAPGSVVSQSLGFIAAAERLSKGISAFSLPEENRGNIASELAGASAGINHVVDEVSKGLALAVTPVLSARALISEICNSRFTPELAASIAGAGEAFSRQVEGLMGALNSPSFQTSVAGFTSRHDELLRAVSVISEGLTHQQRVLSAGLAGMVTPAIAPRLFAANKVVFPDLTAGLDAQVLAAGMSASPSLSIMRERALSLIHDQRRTDCLLRDALRGVPQSLVEKLSSPAPTLPDEGTEERTTLGNTELVTPSRADASLLEEEAQRLGFPARSQQVFLHIADSIAALPSEMRQVYEHPSNQRFLAMLVVLAALSTGTPSGFFALLGAYYGTIKPFLDHRLKGD